MHWKQCKKPQLSARYHFWKKKQENLAKAVIFDHFDKFGRFFLIFSKTVLCRELRFFALLSVHQNLSFDISKSTIWQLLWFFALRGDPWGVLISHFVDRTLSRRIHFLRYFAAGLVFLRHDWFFCGRTAAGFSFFWEWIAEFLRYRGGGSREGVNFQDTGGSREEVNFLKYRGGYLAAGFLFSTTGRIQYFHFPHRKKWNFNGE